MDIQTLTKKQKKGNPENSKTSISHLNFFLLKGIKILFGSTIIYPYAQGISHSNYILKTQMLLDTRVKGLQYSLLKEIQRNETQILQSRQINSLLSYSSEGNAPSES